MNYVASQYALAAFSLACEKQQETSFKTLWDQTISGFDELTLKFFIHPAITKEQKKAVISQTIQDDLVKNLLYVLIDNRRLEILQAISDEYAVLLNNRTKIMDVTVHTKTAMTESQLTQLNEKLAKEHRREIKIINRIDSNIIAGMKIEYEGYVIDETVNRQLDDLKMHLKK